MKAVLISLHPEWWALMLSGDKLLELRKTFPQKIATPFRVIVYLTAPVCAVVGDFVCDGCMIVDEYSGTYAQALLSKKSVREYANGKTLYGWDVDGAQAYKEPRRIADYGLKRPPQSWCYVEDSAK